MNASACCCFWTAPSNVAHGDGGARTTWGCLHFHSHSQPTHPSFSLLPGAPGGLASPPRAYRLLLQLSQRDEMAPATPVCCVRREILRVVGEAHLPAAGSCLSGFSNSSAERVNPAGSHGAR